MKSSGSGAGVRPPMNAPSASVLLDAWEHAAQLPPGRRALRLLEGAGAHDPRELAGASVGETDRRLLALHERLFGRTVEVVGRCPRCGDAVEFALDLAAVRLDPAERRNSPAKITVLGIELECRLPTALDLDDVRSAGAGAARRLFERCLLHASREGATLEGAALPPEVFTAAGAALEALDPQAALAIALHCPACGGDWQAPLDPGALFWAEFDAWAKNLLREVDRIARAYGWSENEILALSAPRRRRYLELIAS